MPKRLRFCEKMAWTRSRGTFILAIATGHAKQAKAMLERTKLAASMEPIWHAARAELGEELEPLPAEVMDAVKTVRKRVAALRPP